MDLKKSEGEKSVKLLKTSVLILHLIGNKAPPTPYGLSEDARAFNRRTYPHTGNGRAVSV